MRVKASFVAHTNCIACVGFAIFGVAAYASVRSNDVVGMTFWHFVSFLFGIVGAFFNGATAAKSSRDESIDDAANSARVVPFLNRSQRRR